MRNIVKNHRKLSKNQKKKKVKSAKNWSKITRIIMPMQVGYKFQQTKN